MDQAADETGPVPVTPMPADIGAGVGAYLRGRRLELGLSPGDVAASVKLTARRIVALEEERWEELPDGPYLRGFLRNVARALQIDAEALLRRVDASLMQTRNPDSILVAPGVAHAVMPRRSGRLDDRRSSRGWIIGACVFALIAAGIAWSGTESFERTVTGGRSLLASRAAPEVAAPAPAPADSQPTADPTPQVAAADASSPGADAATVAKGGSQALPPPGVEPATAAKALVFHFSEDSWIEVKSADGKILVQRLNPAGSEQEVDGAAPFSLIVGNAKGVDLRFRGQPVDLGPHTRDQVARLTLP